MESFSFIQVTDHHLGDHPAHLHNGYPTNFIFEHTLHQIAAGGHSADFLISTGDVVDPPTADGYAQLRTCLGIENASTVPGPLQITKPGLPRLPFYCIPGNHDDRTVMAEVLFAAHPAGLVNTVFVHKGMQFICLDWGEGSQAASSPGFWAFLEKALSSSLPSILISHHAVVPVGTRWLDSFVAEDVGRFWEIVTSPGANSRVMGILCGHTHITYDKIVDNIPVLGLRSTCYTFALADHVQAVIDSPHYRLVTIKDGILTSRIYEVPIPSSARVVISSER